MEIVNFSESTWQEIPEQDNPAMQKSKHIGTHLHKHDRDSECIMIFKGKFDRINTNGVAGGIVVAHVPLDGDMIKKCVCWTIECAELFAKTLAG